VMMGALRGLKRAHTLPSVKTLREGALGLQVRRSV
jgi:hypothetical protein